jgi:hypothetical protein
MLSAWQWLTSGPLLRSIPNTNRNLDIRRIGCVASEKCRYGNSRIQTHRDAWHSSKPAEDSTRTNPARHRRIRFGRETRAGFRVEEPE